MPSKLSSGTLSLKFMQRAGPPGAQGSSSPSRPTTSTTEKKSTSDGGQRAGSSGTTSNPFRSNLESKSFQNRPSARLEYETSLLAFPLLSATASSSLSSTYPGEEDTAEDDAPKPAFGRRSFRKFNKDIEKLQKDLNPQTGGEEDEDDEHSDSTPDVRDDSRVPSRFREPGTSSGVRSYSQMNKVRLESLRKARAMGKTAMVTKIEEDERDVKPVRPNQATKPGRTFLKPKGFEDVPSGSAQVKKGKKKRERDGSVGGEDGGEEAEAFLNNLLRERQPEVRMEEQDDESEDGDDEIVQGARAAPQKKGKRKVKQEGEVEGKRSSILSLSGPLTPGAFPQDSRRGSSTTDSSLHGSEILALGLKNSDGKPLQRAPRLYVDGAKGEALGSE